MVKPQFELGPERVGKGGVVREAADRREALRAVAEAARGGGPRRARASPPSGLPGPKGNRETFIRLARAGSSASRGRRVEAAIETGRAVS